MRTAAFILVVAVLCTPAAAVPPELAAGLPAKAAPTALPNTPLPRQGGDTVADALPIPSLPFGDTGTTTGYADDYDAACPYQGSTSPDVVYVFVPEDTVTAFIDLCGSGYDTKVYVLNAALDVIACNDDAYAGEPCGAYVSRIDCAELPAGEPAYVVIDGYGGEHGDYVIAMNGGTGTNPCPVPQPGWAWVENEPPLHDGYVDSYNGGCNSPEFGAPMSTLELWYGSLTYGFWGTSGWFASEGAPRRDTDWIRIQDILDYFPLTLVIEAEQPTTAYVLWPQDCDNVAVAASLDVQPCLPGTLQVEHFAYGYPREAWLWVGPSSVSPPECADQAEYHYSVKVLEYVDDPQPVPPSADYSLGCPVIPAGDYAYWTNDLSGFTNQFDPAMGGDGCAVTDGRDMVFAVYLEDGDHFSARIRHDWLPLDGDTARDDPPYPVYVVDDCRLGPGSCIASAIHITGWTGVGFYAPATGWYYLVWDGEGSDGVGSHMHTDNDAGRVPPPPPANDDCAGATTIAPGPIALTDDLSDARNTFDPGRDGCAGPGGTGRDIVYRVALAPGQVLDVTMTGDGAWDEELYLIADCDDPMTTCVAGGTADGLGGVRLTYTAETWENLWLVCDSYGNGPRPFTLTGSLAEPTGAPQVPSAVALLGCQPNPFNPRTRIAFTLPDTRICRLAVYALDGARVRTLIDEPRGPGRHEIAWDGRDDRGSAVAAGAYLIRLVAGETVLTERALLVR